MNISLNKLSLKLFKKEFFKQEVEQEESPKTSRLKLASTANPDQTCKKHRRGFDPRKRAIFHPDTGTYVIPV